MLRYTSKSMVRSYQHQHQRHHPLHHHVTAQNVHISLRNMEIVCYLMSANTDAFFVDYHVMILACCPFLSLSVYVSVSVYVFC
jgi:hypothetical protein